MIVEHSAAELSTAMAIIEYAEDSKLHITADQIELFHFFRP